VVLPDPVPPATPIVNGLLTKAMFLLVGVPAGKESARVIERALG
jgi:hypothetical protein